MTNLEDIGGMFSLDPFYLYKIRVAPTQRARHQGSAFVKSEGGDMYLCWGTWNPRPL